jgi:hypothetical protein
MLAILLVAIGAPSVRADSVYAITFFDGFFDGHPTVVGSNLLDFDSISQSFTTPSLTVRYEGETIILENVGLSGADPNFDYGWWADAMRGTITIGYLPCLISGNLEPCNIYIGGPFNFNPNFTPFENGQVTFSLITPEPSSVALLLLGMGLVLLLRHTLTRRILTPNMGL